MLLPENLMPLCCRLWESSLPDPPCWSAVHLVVLRSLVSVAQEKLRMSWEDRLLRHLTAKLQRYYTARMKCNISASLNVWHLDRSSAEALTLRLPFCNVLRPSSRMERRVCWVFFFKINHPNKIILTQPASQSCCGWLFLGRYEAHTRNRKMLHKLTI